LAAIRFRIRVGPRLLAARDQVFMSSKILWLISLVAALSPLSAAQAPVAIDNEPMHRLKFKNELVWVFDVLVPAGKATLMHTHVFDGVSVRISNAEMTDQFVDGTSKEFAIHPGQTGFASGPEFSHRVINRGKTDFRNVYIELLPAKEPLNTTTIPPLTAAHVVDIDNARVRVNRLILKPGESSKPHTHKLNGLGVMLYDAKVEITAPDGTRRVVEAKAGDVIWQAAGTAHTLKNIGKTVFEAIDVEIKQ
jgi:uncharacterized cupin superfamily protein